MGKKKQEMSQVYSGSNNEFVFGESGGKGKNLSLFLKNLSLTNKLSESNNSDIYGSLGAGPRKLGDGQPTPYSFLLRTVSGNLAGATPERLQSPSTRKVLQKYADLDDDWDADLEEPIRETRGRAEETRVSGDLQQLVFIDSFHPEMGFTLVSTYNKGSSNTRNLKGNGPLQQGIKGSHVSKDSPNSIYDPKFALGSSVQQAAADSKHLKFESILEAASISLPDLRKVSWNGIPNDLRGLSWQLLLGYLPATKLRQSATLSRKRQEYTEALDSIRDVDFSLTSGGSPLYHQINIDVKRTHPSIPLYSHPTTQKLLRKILYLWAIRHPASGYVQGINDLSTPFFQTFLDHYLWLQSNSKFLIPQTWKTSVSSTPNPVSGPVTSIDPADIPPEALSAIEADTYWCLLRLLDNITDNYIPQQPGIIRQVQALQDLVSKIDPELYNHLEAEGVQFLQFAFRWMNCLLMRELKMPLAVRMWDTYLLETPLGFHGFHVYVCAAFLIKFADDLKRKDFQEIILFLQNPPTEFWGDKDVELMLLEAFIWQSLYKNAAAHLR